MYCVVGDDPSHGLEAAYGMMMDTAIRNRKRSREQATRVPKTHCNVGGFFQPGREFSDHLVRLLSAHLPADLRMVRRPTETKGFVSSNKSTN